MDIFCIIENIEEEKLISQFEFIKAEILLQLPEDCI